MFEFESNGLPFTVGEYVRWEPRPGGFWVEGTINDVGVSMGIVIGCARLLVVRSGFEMWKVGELTNLVSLANCRRVDQKPRPTCGKCHVVMGPERGGWYACDVCELYVRVGDDLSIQYTKYGREKWLPWLMAGSRENAVQTQPERGQAIAPGDRFAAVAAELKLLDE